MESIMENFGWVFIGCGKIAEKAAKSLIEAGAGRIAAVWNRTRARAEKFAEKYGGKVYGTAEEALNSGADCAYIATTHDRHAYYTELAVKAGVPVLCEKPVAVNFNEAERAFALAKESGVYVAEAMWTWHNPVSLKVKQWLSEGKIGDVKKVKAKFAFPMMYVNRNPRLVKPELAGGVLLDLGIYPIRYVYELFGMPSEIVCTGSLKGGIDTEEKIIMKYGGFEAEIFVSMKRLRGEKVVIEGDRGRIIVPYFHTAGAAYLTGESRSMFKGDKNPFGIEFRHTAEDLLNGANESAYCPVKNTLDVMRLLDECRKQMKIVYPCEKN